MTTQITTTTVSTFTLHDLTEAQFTTLASVETNDLYLTEDTSVVSTTIRNIVTCTQVEYDALTAKDSNTFYIITDAASA